jgi:hypothetical protein
MGLFDNNDGSALRSHAPNSEVTTRDLPKLVVGHGNEGVPSLKISNPSQYRYTKEETGQHPLADRSDAILPPKYKGDHTFDPTTRVFEPASIRNDITNDRVAFGEHQQNVNPNFKAPEAVKDNATNLQMPERSLFSGGSSGGDSSLKGPDLAIQKSFSSLFEPSRSKGNNDGSLFVIIIASLAVLLSSILKFIAQVFWPWVNRMNFRKRRVRFLRR